MFVKRLLVASLLMGATVVAQCATVPYQESLDALAVGDGVCGSTSPGTLPAGWNSTGVGGSTWMVWSGTDPFAGVAGVTGDAAAGVGQYLVASPDCSGAFSGELELPCFDTSALINPVLEFYVHVESGSSLQVQRDTGGGNWVLIWNSLPGLEVGWNYVQIPVSATTSERVRFVGTANNSGLNIDEVQVGEPSPAFWQQDGNIALTVNGAVNSGPYGQPAVATVGISTAVEMLAVSAGTEPFDVATVLSPLISGAQPNRHTATGQVFHFDWTDPTLVFVNSGTATPWPTENPGEFRMPFIAPPVSTSICGQAIQYDPSNGDGFSLSQGVQLDTGISIVQGPTGDDSAVVLPLTTALGGSPFTFYGVTYTEISVISNGRVIFGNLPDTDFSPSVGEALSDAPFFGFWTDLNPASAGQITVTRLGTAVIVDYVGVVYFSSAIPVSFSLTIDGANQVLTMNGLTGIVPGPRDQFFGFSAGSLGARDNGAISFFTTPHGTVSGKELLYDARLGGTLVNGLQLVDSLQHGIDAIRLQQIGNSYVW